jgi:hypothetical protein
LLLSPNSFVLVPSLLKFPVKDRTFFPVTVSQRMPRRREHCDHCVQGQRPSLSLRKSELSSSSFSTHYNPSYSPRTSVATSETEKPSNIASKPCKILENLFFNYQNLPKTSTIFLNTFQNLPQFSYNPPKTFHKFS